MTLLVRGNVTLNGTQAVVILDVQGQSTPRPDPPAPPLQVLLQKVLGGQVHVHESRLPVLRKHIAAMVCNVQGGLKLSPVGLFGAWTPEAEGRLPKLLEKPKVVRPAAT